MVSIFKSKEKKRKDAVKLAETQLKKIERAYSGRVNYSLSYNDNSVTFQCVVDGKVAVHEHKVKSDNDFKIRKDIYLIRETKRLERVINVNS